ncbi:MAG: hypothetical protein AAGI88_18300 [Pseudomonadota bacterium]
MRTVLLGGCLSAVILSSLITPPAPVGDPDLTTLMLGMAAVKGLLVLAALAVLWWRFGHAITRSTAALYCIGAWLASASVILIAQRAFLPTAIVLFHAGELLLLLTAWRDDHVSMKSVTSEASARDDTEQTNTLYVGESSSEQAAETKVGEANGDFANAV